MRSYYRRERGIVTKIKEKGRDFRKMSDMEDNLQSPNTSSDTGDL